ncbi:hypothetical protein [Phaffia rhodozyma]|uniref:Uncharacterized protein n=1 Tax=Phaffia rhodozyma TaxID=264483 RepID=A0A0F7SS61_PHARH|nr:hypothetical protein [Phaffia rhodozyma]
MAKQTPVYDLEEYLLYRDSVEFNSGMTDILSNIDQDQLNQRGPDTPKERSQSDIEIERDLAFYGPSLSLHGHAAGPYDWITLPRVNASSSDQPEHFFVPWHITFELQSNLKVFAVGKANWFIKDPKSKPDEHPMNFAYNEEKALESREIWHSILGHHNGSSRRPILRAIFRLVGHLIQFPGLIILQVMFVYTRNSSAGISIPSNLLLLFLPMVRVAYKFSSEPLISKGVHTIEMVSSLSAIWLWACLWWGFEIQWGGWNALLPVGVKRNKPTHSERRSKRVDSQFTWFQRGLFVVVLTICMAHVHKLPELITSTHRYTRFSTSTPSLP